MNPFSKLPSRFQMLMAVVTVATALVMFGTSAVGLYVAIEARSDIKNDLQEIHILMNSRLDQLLEETRKNARAKGIVEGENN